MAVTINGTTGLAVPLGSASAPGVVNTTSATTGIYNPTSTTLALATNGTNAVTIDASQNVGIGTTSPSSYGTNITTLDVRGTSGSGVKFGTAANYGMYYNGGIGYVQTFDASPIVLATNNAERMRIDTSGNVQVGGATVANTVGYVNSRTNTRAWVRWVGSTGAVTSSYNVSSVTRNSTGNYTVNFTTSLADANYAPIGMTAGAATYNSFGVYMQQTSAPLAASCAVTTLSNAGTAVDNISNQLVVFGN